MTFCWQWPWRLWALGSLVLLGACSDAEVGPAHAADGGLVDPTFAGGGGSDALPTDSETGPSPADAATDVHSVDSGPMGSPDVPTLPDVEAPPDVPEPGDVSIGTPDVANVPDVAPQDATDTTGCALPCAPTGECCAGAESCLSIGCVVVGGTCANDDDCLSDTWCLFDGPAPGVCVPYGKGPKPLADPGCAKVVPSGVFFPELQCEWSGPPAGDPFPDHVQVLGMPMVARLQLFGGSSDQNGYIVFVSYDGTDGGFDSASCCGVIRVIRGADCHQVYTLSAAKVVGGSAPAIADLDLAPDGRPEIVALAEGGGLVAFKYDEATSGFILLWHSTEPDGVAKDTLAGDKYRWNGPTIADVTGDAHPEILVDGTVYGWDGVKLPGGVGWVGYKQGIFPIVADLDLDGEPEVLLGNRSYRIDPDTQALVAAPAPFGGDLTGGYGAIADFGPHGVAAGFPSEAAEIVLVRNGEVAAYDLTGAPFFGPLKLPGGGAGGPPTISDFDGDGHPELAAAGLGSYTVFDPDCEGDPLPPGCTAQGVLWTRPSQDKSSSVTGSSVFDFEGDGRAEAVYADECFVRVYDGKNGDVLFSGPRSSCTWHESPVVADVDGDYRTEVVVGSNGNCNIECPAIDPVFVGLRCDEDAQCASGSCVQHLCRCGSDAGCPTGYQCAAPPAPDGLGDTCRASHGGKANGIRVFRDSKDHWVGSRPIWNQHAYHVTNVTDEGVVPPREVALPNWTQPELNNFRSNAPGAAQAKAAPDLTIKGAEPPVTCNGGAAEVLHMEVCNRGISPVAKGIAVAAYLGEPGAPAGPLCDAITNDPIQPGACVQVSCAVPSVASGATVWLAVDGGGEDGGAYLECLEENNLGIVEVACP